MTASNTHSANGDLVSIVVTTKNEEKNIEHCLKSIQAQTWKPIEIIVVDNKSSDATKEIALRFTPLVFDKGPERSAQRNFGMIEKAHGRYVMYVDADMILSPRLVERCVDRMTQGDPVALHVPEIVLGTSFWGCVRRFERCFYDGTVVDGARFFDREVFRLVGGFDEGINGPEDWDLDKKLKKIGNIVLLQTPISGESVWELDSFLRQRGVNRKQFGESVFHNESDFCFRRYIIKKNYYTLGFNAYISKWGKNDPDIRRQFGGAYRYICIFTEKGKWRRLIHHPILVAGMLFLRISVGCVFISRKIQWRINWLLNEI